MKDPRSGKRTASPAASSPDFNSSRQKNLLGKSPASHRTFQISGSSRRFLLSPGARSQPKPWTTGLLLGLLLGITVLGTPGLSSPRPAPPRTAADLVPKRAFAAIRVRDGIDLIDSLLESDFVQALVNSKSYRDLEKTPEFLQVKAVAATVAAVAGWTPAETLGQLLGKETVFALCPDLGDSTGWLVVSVLDSDERIDLLLRQASSFLGPRRAGSPLRRDGEIQPLGPQVNYTRFGSVLALSNRRELLQECRALDQRRERKGRLGSTEAYRFAKRQAGGQSLFGLLEFDNLRRVTSGSFPPNRFDNALAALVFGEYSARLGEARYAAIGMEFTSRGGRMRGVMPLIGSSADAKTPSSITKTRSSRGSVSIPRPLGQIRLRRDLSGLWDAGEEMLSRRGLGDLLQFSSTLTTLLGGLDFAEDLLPALGEDLLLVSNTTLYPGKSPSPQLPGFALILPIEAGSEIGSRLELASLQALALLSLNATNEGKETLFVDREKRGEARITFGRYKIHGESPGPLPIRHNFSPATAVVGESLIVSSDLQLTRDLVDSLQDPNPAENPPSSPRRKKRAAPTGKTDAELVLDGERLHEILLVNRDLMIDNKAVENDVPRHQAQREIDFLLSLVNLTDQLRVEVSRKPRQLELALEIALELPE